MKKACSTIILGVAAMLVASCGSEQVVDPPSCQTDPALCPAGPDTVSQFLASLPTWQDFAQPDTTRVNEINAAADTLPVVEQIVDSIPMFDDNGLSGWDRNVRFVCEEKPYTIQDTPEEIVMFDPDRSILYAGAFIQGKTHKNQVGSLLGLAIPQRAPIRVSVSDVGFEMVNPTQAEVEAARIGLVQGAVKDNLATPSSSNFTMESYHSEQSYALNASLSGRYLGFSASASGSLDRSIEETTVTAHYTEAMYTVSVEGPSSPDAWFTEDFDNDELAKLGDKIGPDNLPVYISEIVYGRMMMFSVTSSASESEIISSMQASYDNLVGSASGGINDRQRAVLENSKIAITAIGGSGEATRNMIVSGDWSTYFESSVALTQAVPISYTFRNVVGDGAIASVTEATEYTITTCSPKPLVPGVFDFDLVQGLTVPLTPGYRTLVGDFNNDQMDDLLFNYAAGSSNDVVVALAQADRTFSVQPITSNTEVLTEGWSLYEAHIGDFNNDDMTDILWNARGAENVFYVGLSNGDGTFQWGGRMSYPGGGWTNYGAYIADVDGVNGDDIVWNEALGSSNRTYVALSQADGTFDMTVPSYVAAGTASWNGTRTFIDDVNGDGTVDMIFNRITNNNDIWVAPGNGDGTYGATVFSQYGQNGYGDYKTLLGDINRTLPSRADLFFVADGRPDIPIHRGVGDQNSQFVRLSWHHIPDSADGTGPFEIRMGDVDADGDTDMILVDLDGSNNRPISSNQAKIWVGLATDDDLGERFDFGPIDQLHPSVDSWNQYEVFVMDVNGDNKSDIVLSWNTSPHNIYVVHAK